jgi:GNAT superfamily N-acetyltransferase
MEARQEAVDASVPRWSLLEVAAQRALLVQFARSPRARSAPLGAPVRWVITGVDSNTHNGVAATRLAEPDADAAIADTLRRLAGRPAIWHVADNDTPTDLPARLVRAGCRPERNGVVMGRPTHAAIAVPPPRGVRIAEITDAADLAAWQRVAGGVWHDATGEELERQAMLYASLPLGPGTAWRHWLAWTDRARPVGMASGLFADKTVLIEHVGVLQNHRGTGIGAALVTTAVTAAGDVGAGYVVLGPTRKAGHCTNAWGLPCNPRSPTASSTYPDTRDSASCQQRHCRVERSRDDLVSAGRSIVRAHGMHIHSPSVDPVLDALYVAITALRPRPGWSITPTGSSSNLCGLRSRAARRRHRRLYGHHGDCFDNAIAESFFATPANRASSAAQVQLGPARQRLPYTCRPSRIRSDPRSRRTAAVPPGKPPRRSPHHHRPGSGTPRSGPNVLG